jgi:mannobiose 2-epimerase
MTETERLKHEVREVLENNILHFWMTKMVDAENGGFYGRIDGHNVLHKDADKGAILNARILWTLSAAYRVLRKPEYLVMATRAKRYLIDHFIDHEYGGVYWSLDYTGQPKDTKKQFYAIGFAIYGLSEYVRATGDDEALQQAVRLYRTVEEHALDREYNGYIEAMTRNWQPIGDMRLSEHDANYPKSQNTHLHIIEPYTNLYRVWHSAELEKSLRNIIGIFTDRILNPVTHHLDLFFDMDWTRSAVQTESYGHDIECSWLLHEAALVLGDKDVLTKVESVVRMVAKASEQGLNADGSMIHERQLSGTVDDDLHWWVQAEAVVGFLNLYQHFHDEAALEKALRCWQYIKNNLIDTEHGEWYWSRHKDGTLNTVDDKAGFWKCPYHNGRMCMEILERIF